MYIYKAKLFSSSYIILFCRYFPNHIIFIKSKLFISIYIILCFHYFTNPIFTESYVCSLFTEF